MTQSFKEQYLQSINKQSQENTNFQISFKDQFEKQSSSLPLLSPSKFAQLQTETKIKKLKEPSETQMQQIRAFMPFTKQFELSKQELQQISDLSPKNKEKILADIQAQRQGIKPEKPLETPYVDVPFAASIAAGGAAKLALSGGAGIAEAIIEGLTAAQTAVLSEPFVGQTTEIVTEKIGKIDPRLKPLAAIGTSIVTGMIAAKAIDNIAKSNILRNFRLKKITPDSKNVETALEIVKNDIKTGKITSDFTDNIIKDIRKSITRIFTRKAANEVIDEGISSQFKVDAADEAEILARQTGKQQAIIKNNILLPIKPEEKGLYSLAEETGAVRLPDLSAIKEGAADYQNTFKKLLNKWEGLDTPTKEAFIAIEETDKRIAEQSVNIAVDVYKVKKGINKTTRLLISNAMEQQNENLLPKNLKSIAEDVKNIQNKLLVKQQEAGIDIAKWPDNWIIHNEKEIKNFDKQIDDILVKVDNIDNLSIKSKNPEKIKKMLLEKYQKKINNLQQKKEDLEKITEKLRRTGFVSRVTREKLTTKTKRIIGLTSKKLAVRPKVGRVFITRQEAEKAGFEVGDPVEGLADYIYTANKSLMMKELIDTINENKNFSSKIKLDPSWVKISADKFPSARNRWYHPAIADAVNELTWVNNSGLIMKTIDKFNMTIKHIGFYNPFMMLGVNDLQQSWRFGGFTGVPREVLGITNKQDFKTVINSFKNDDFKGIWKHIFDNSALNEVLNKSDLYLKAEAAGLFSNVLDRTPQIKAMVEETLDIIEKTKGQRFAEQLKRNILNPLTILKDAKTFSDKVTWTGDQVWRMAGLKFALKSKRFEGLSFFEIVDKVNDNFAAYNKIPKETQKDLNRLGYTPNYKINMARKLAKIWKEPKRHWPELLRHYMLKIFMKTVLPGIVTLMFTQKLKGKPKMKGYQLRIPIEYWDDEKKKYRVREKVYSFSGPLFEEAKLLNRKLSTTLQFNASAVANIIIKFAQGARYYRMRDENGKPLSDQKKVIRRMSEFFKIGMPIERELRIFQREDVENFDKFMSLFGIAYVYHRKPKKDETEWANQLTAILAMMDLWTDWKKRGQEIKKDVFEESIKYKKKKKKEIKIPKGKFNPLSKELRKLKNITKF